MSKNIKSLISEAFEELFLEITENKSILKESIIRDEEVDMYIKNAIEKGRGIPYNYASEDKKSEINFKKIINKLADEYKKTKNPKIKQSIQSTYIPSYNSKIANQLSLTTNISKKNKDFEDAISSAYEQVVLNNFDKMIDSYTFGSNFGAMIASDMANKMKNYIIYGYRGSQDGGSKLDAIGGEEKSLSLDQTLGDDGETTFGDKLASKIGIEPESAEEIALSKERRISKMREILNDVVSFLDNTFDENGDEMGKRRMIAFKGILNGDSTEEIFEDNPGVFKEPRYVSIEFERLVNSPEAKEISRMISDEYGINFNLSGIDPKKLKQTSSMNPEFGGFSKNIKISTPEMQAAQKNLNKELESVGLKSTDFNSEKKKEQVINKLTSLGKTKELENILDAEEELNKVTEKAKAAGKYDVKTALLPSTPEEEKEAGLFEGVDFNKLMERIIKRLK